MFMFRGNLADKKQLKKYQKKKHLYFISEEMFDTVVLTLVH